MAPPTADSGHEPLKIPNIDLSGPLKVASDAKGNFMESLAKQINESPSIDYHYAVPIFLGSILVVLVWFLVRRAKAYQRELDEMVREARKRD